MRTTFITAVQILPIITAFFLLGGCESTQFKSYEGKGEFLGKVETYRTIEGIDFWENGYPPRKFEIVYEVLDETGSDFFALLKNDRSIVNLAKAQGGDAVILPFEERKVQGLRNKPGNKGEELVGGYRIIDMSQSPVPLIRMRHVTSLLIIKYLPSKT